MLKDDRGFGAAEALVAMLLLAMFAVSLAPMLVASLRAATAYMTVTTATQAVSEHLAPVSTRTLTCAQVEAWLAATPSAVTDPRGTTVHVHRSAAPVSRAGDGSLVCVVGRTVTVLAAATDTAAASGGRTHASAHAVIRIKSP